MNHVCVLAHGQWCACKDTHLSRHFFRVCVWGVNFTSIHLLSLLSLCGFSFLLLSGTDRFRSPPISASGRVSVTDLRRTSAIFWKRVIPLSDIVQQKGVFSSHIKSLERKVVVNLLNFSRVISTATTALAAIEQFSQMDAPGTPLRIKCPARMPPFDASVFCFVFF